MNNEELLKSIEDSSLSLFTKRNYIQKAIVLTKLLDKSLEYIIQHPKIAIKKINNTYTNIGSRKTFYTFILAIFRYNDDLKCKYKDDYELWRKEFSESDEIIAERYKQNAPSKKQIEGFVAFEDIVKKRDTLEDGSDSKLLLSFYTYIPPLRADFGRVFVGKDKKHSEDNYLHNNYSELILGKYKTAKTHNEFKKELPKELILQIKKSLENKPREYLFTTRDGKPMLKNTYTKWCNRTLQFLFKKPLTVSLIRHAFINTLDFNKLTIKEKEEIAADMTHTANMQDKYRLIF